MSAKQKRKGDSSASQVLRSRESKTKESHVLNGSIAMFCQPATRPSRSKSEAQLIGGNSNKHHRRHLRPDAQFAHSSSLGCFCVKQNGLFICKVYIGWTSRKRVTGSDQSCWFLVVEFVPSVIVDHSRGQRTPNKNRETAQRKDSNGSRRLSCRVDYADHICQPSY